MTICISAICTENDKEHVVFAVDHMISTMMGQFEHNIKKYTYLTGNTVGMFAGNALLMDYFLEDDYSSKSYDEIKKRITSKFKEKRLEYIKKNILDVYSIDFDYVRELLKNEITNEFQMRILKEITKIKLNSAILLVGFDENKAKISEISDSGVENFDKINFHAIGSGSIQAQNTLLFQEHSKEDNLKVTLYNVYKAKKNAEVMQGVGYETDIGYLNNESIKILKETNINILDEIYKSELIYGKTNKKLDDLNI